MNSSAEINSAGAPHSMQGTRVDWHTNNLAEDVPPSSFLGTIACAMDCSTASTHAFAHALAIALLRRARLRILHVGSDHHVGRSGFPAVRATLERWGLLKPGSSQRAVFEEFGIRVTKRSISSRIPASAVVDYLDETPADLLVVATGAREAATRWLRGTTAQAVSKSFRTMTLFVPAEAERTIVSPSDGNLTLNSMLIPVDHAPDPNLAVEFARRAAAIIGNGNVTITLLYVGAQADASPRVDGKDGAGWKFVRMRREGDPVAEILATADLVRAELIVMPTAGRTGVFEALSGSTTGRVFQRVRCPVLAVPTASLVT